MVHYFYVGWSTMKICKNWKDRLLEAALHGKFSPDDIDRAETWQFCYIGEHELTHDGRTVAKKLGVAFMRAVRRHHVKAAIRIVQKIDEKYGLS